MLRAVVAVLLAANLAFLGWSQGWLDGVTGVRAAGEGEPQRLAQQVHPEALHILSLEALRQAAVPKAPPVPPACLQAGPFSPEDAAAAEAAVRTAITGLAPDQLLNLEIDRPGIWLVYMGRFPTPEALQRKRDELQRTRVPLVVVDQGPAELVPGLSLGRYERRADAEAALAELEQHGFRTARVVTFQAPGTLNLLRVDAADAALQSRLAALADPALKGQAFSACPVTAAAGNAAPAPAGSSPASAPR